MQAAMLIGAPLEHAFLARHVPPVQTAIGIVLGLAGLALGVLSFKALGRNFRVYMAPRRSGTLVTTGIYRYVRHPMYTGVIVGFLGYLILFGSLFLVPVWVVMTLLYVIKTAREERALADKYLDYEEYRQKTWRFIPYVY
jgi:protein-S-isoprenylcysteine O-methyltransferase Ste14